MDIQYSYPNILLFIYPVNRKIVFDCVSLSVGVSFIHCRNKFRRAFIDDFLCSFQCLTRTKPGLAGGNVAGLLALSIRKYFLTLFLDVLICTNAPANPLRNTLCNSQTLCNGELLAKKNPPVTTGVIGSSLGSGAFFLCVFWASIAIRAGREGEGAKIAGGY